MKKTACTCRITALICLCMIAVLLCACGMDRASGDSTVPTQTTASPDTAFPETTAAPETTVAPETTEPTQNTLPVPLDVPEIQPPADGSRILYELCSDENFYLIQDSIRTELEPVENDTLRLSPEAVLSDGRIVWIFFSLEHLGGEDLSVYNSLTCDFEFSFTQDPAARGVYLGAKSYGVLADSVEDPQLCANAAEALGLTDQQLLCYAAFESSSGPLSSIRLHLTGLSDYQIPEVSLETELIAEIPVGSTLVTAAGSDPSGRFQEVVLSPVGLWIDINQAWEEETQETGMFPGTFYDMTLKFRDGTEFQITAQDLAGETEEDYGWFGNHQPNGTNRACIQVRFREQFLDPASVGAIVIDGVEVPLSVS